MLLARLERQHIAVAAVHVGGLAHHPARHLTHMLLATAQDAEIRPTAGHGRAERLAFADHDIRALAVAPLAGCLQQRQRHRIDDPDGQRAVVLCPVS